MTALSDQLDDFNDHEKILDFPSIGESLCPSDYKLQFDKSRVVFYKPENCKTFGIPIVTKAIAIDNNLHVKVFLFWLPYTPPSMVCKGKGLSTEKKVFFWKAFHRSSKVFQIIKPQISWMNYSKSDIKNVMTARNSRQNFCNLP